MKRVFIYLYLLCLPLSALCQGTRLYTTRHGLMTANFRSISIDNSDMAWISSEGKIALFDGSHFYYISNIDKKTGEPLFRVSYGVRQYDTNNYLVTTNTGLYSLNSRTNEYKYLPLPGEEKMENRYSVNHVTDYVNPGQKYVTTDGFGSFVYDINTQKVDEKETSAINKLANTAFVCYAFIDTKNRLWLNNINNELTCIDIKKKEKISVNFSENAKRALLSGRVNDMLEHRGNIYIGTSNSLLYYDDKTNNIERIEGINAYVKSVINGPDKSILIGTDGEGIWTIDPKNNNCHPLNIHSTQLGMRHAKICDLAMDSEGNIIAEIFQKGILIIPPQYNVFRHYPVTAEGDVGNSSAITSLATDKDGKFWISTDGSGVFVSSGKFLNEAVECNKGLHNKLIQSLIIDKNNTPWCATYGNGVQMWQNEWTYGDNDWLSPIRDMHIMNMCYNPEQDIIYAASNGHGIYRICAADKTVEPFDFKGLKNEWVGGMFFDSKNNIWALTASGVYYYNPKTDKHAEIKYNGKTLFDVVDMAEYNGDILFASNDGILVLDSNTNSAVPLNITGNYLSSSIQSIQINGDDIWVATSNGISCISGKQHNIYNYSSFSGNYMGEFHKKSSFQTAEGEILFGGNNGILCFSPKEILGRKQKIRDIFFSKLLIGSEIINYSADNDILDASIFYAKRIHLSSHQNTFTIRFSVPEISDPDRIHYDYILKGIDNDWHINNNVPEAFYVSLPSGSYTLKVRAYYEDFPQYAVEKSIEIKIDYPWYLSYWAIFIYTFILGGIAYFLYRNWKEKRQQALQLQKEHDEKQMREEKLRMFTSITHELKSPIMMIESPLDELIQNESDEKKLNLYAIMQRNCQRILDVVKQITDIRRIDAGLFNIHLEEHDYVPYANAVFEQFRGTATIRNIQFIVEHQEQELPMYFDEKHFDKIIFNLLSNAFKFTPEGGKVIVRSQVVGTNIELRFYNSGSHLSDEDMKHLYERFYQGSAGNNSSGSGIGLNLVYELVKLHHGKIESKNIDPDGVEFTLQFPYFNQDVNTLIAGKYTILVVDDDNEIVEYVKSQLESECNVITALSGNKAWRQVIKMRPDVVITDYQMSDGNGIELCQRIKSNPETDSTPVIMLTGEGDESLRIHSLNIQVDHYLEKPVNMQMLRSAISQVLRVREKLRNKVQRLEIGSVQTDEPILSADDKLFKKINDTIREHLDNSEFSVMQLSEEVGISKVHLTRKMKERYGMTPNVYIKSYRLKQAAYLLVHSKLNVNEVMYRVGYSNSSYFTASFHDFFGMPPTQFIAYYTDPEHEEAFSKLINM